MWIWSLDSTRGWTRVPRMSLRLFSFGKTLKRTSALVSSAMVWKDIVRPLVLRLKTAPMRRIFSSPESVDRTEPHVIGLAANRASHRYRGPQAAIPTAMWKFSVSRRPAYLRMVTSRPRPTIWSRAALTVRTYTSGIDGPGTQSARAGAGAPMPLLHDVSADNLPIISTGDRKVAIGWDTRTWSRFHNIWLRDHCRCPKCFHAVTKQRIFNTFEIPHDITPVRVESKPEGLEVSWPDPHVSLYPWLWLQQNSYDPVIKQPDSSNEKILWGAKIAQSPPSVTYEEATAKDDSGLYKWLKNINKFGFSFVSGVPATPEATEQLVERIGFIRQTQYGRFWDFTSDLAKGDTAYTTLPLCAHTDTTYFTDPCGLQLFHLLSHTDGSGGASLLVDGFYAASILKELHPDAYALLSTVHVQSHAAGEPSAIYTPYPASGYPVLGHDKITGELYQVRWNNDDRSVMKGLAPEVVEEWYGALRKWNKCLTSPDSEYWMQLQPGTVVVMDNQRVLHGRSAFDGKRRMCGAYVGMDEYRSKLAVLTETFSPDVVLKATNAMPEAVANGRNIWNSSL